MQRKIPSANGFSPSIITKPIPLLAFMGMMVEGIVGLLAAYSQSTPFFGLLALGLVVLPLVLIISIYRLITRYPTHLYHPNEYPQSDQFISLMKLSSSRILQLNKKTQSIFDPTKTNRSIQQDEKDKINESTIELESILNSVSSKDLLNLHSWYNAIDRHDMALICIDMSIAKGAASSKSFSFRSATLRKLGRLVESSKSAETAIQLDATNIDAYYNLAIINTMLNNMEIATKYKKIILDSNNEPYISKLNKITTIN